LNAYISKYLGQYFGRFLFDYLYITGVSIGYMRNKFTNSKQLLGPGVESLRARYSVLAQPAAAPPGPPRLGVPAVRGVRHCPGG
jgi:hypothetical protein